ncbi:MAG: pyridoxal-phosphate dependent enzyme [Clostridiales bacterium]
MSLYIKTPLLEMLDYSGANRSVSLKMEAYQPVGSFKLRGIETLCKQAIQGGARHLVSSSGGNAGLATAYAGRKLGIKTTVVLPKTTPAFVIDKLEKEKAAVTIQGGVWDEANAYALSLVSTKETAYIPPFDHPALWEGHSTMIDELKADCAEQPDLVVLSVGGGGLMCGVMEGLLKNRWEATRILAVETEGAASLYQSVKSNRLVQLDKIDTSASSLGAKQVTPKALEYANRYNISPYLVSDESANKACVRFLEEYRTMIEPACGASLSVVYDNSPVLQDYKNIVIIVCGGAVVNIEKIMTWKEQYRL